MGEAYIINWGNNPANLLKSLYFTDMAEMINPTPNPSIADCNINRGKRKINGDGKVTEAGFDEQYIEIARNRTKSWITKFKSEEKAWVKGGIKRGK